MMESSESIASFLEDAKQHNQWWDGETGSPSDLTEVTELEPRSDVVNCLKQLDREHDGETDGLVYPIYGPTGIGKTTLLLQIVAALLREDTVAFDPSHRDLELVGSIDPRQVLYIPLEDSLYHLEPSEDAMAALGNVVDYFYTHIAPRTGRKFILLDDVGALRLEGEEKQQLLDLIDDDTSLVVTGIVESEVNMEEVTGSDEVQVKWARPMLPMKFIDTVQHGVYNKSVFEDVDSDLASIVETHRTTSFDEDNSLISDVRNNLSDATALPDAIEALEDLHYNVLSEADRDGLHEAARRYLQKGGLFQRVPDYSVNNELVHSHFLLYLYKELAQYESIKNPENLHRLASLAASRAGQELKYTDISERLGVDRRTVDTYLSLLDEGLSVSESHDYSLQRYRRTRLYLRNPRHVVLLSQRQEHFGFESYEPTGRLNHDFEYKLARTVGFDHAKRLAYQVEDDFEGEDPQVEYCETEAGTVDYVLRNDELVLPFVLSYHPHTDASTSIATAFDPSVGKHPQEDGEDLIDLEYQAPFRFIVTDSLPKDLVKSESLVIERDGWKLCYLPYWLFLLIC
nr:AAA family ATPase [Halosimplex aquaticum]